VVGCEGAKQQTPIPSLIPANQTPHQQIDALKFEPFIDSLVEGLGLDNGYTVVVVNPRTTDEKWVAGLCVCVGGRRLCWGRGAVT
jgi:hypothetical protein